MLFGRVHILAIAAVVMSVFSISSYGQSQPVLNPGNADSKVTYKPGSAWTLSFPLGLHDPAEIDTLTYNYQRRSIPNMWSDAYATTGNLGAEGINMLYFERPDNDVFFFKNALYPWLASRNSQKNYNVYIPTTILSYNFAGNRNNHTDRLQADFAGNVNRRIGIGAFVDYLYSKGCYEAQAAKNFQFGGNVYYLGDRYEMQAEYSHYNLINKENGGITNDLYIIDPAQLQGGVDKIEAKSIPVRLSSTHNRMIGDDFFMTHTLKLGYWKEEAVNDTLTRDVYVPVTRFVYSFDYTSAHHFFINNNTSQAHDFWQNFYMNSQGTRENTFYRCFTNSIGVEMIEGFKKWAKFGLSAYAMLESRRFRQASYPGNAAISDFPDDNLTPLPAEVDVPDGKSQNRLFVGGRITKQQGSIIRYNASVRFGLTDDAAGDIDANGQIETRFKLFGDTVDIRGDIRFRNEKPSYLLNNFISNHFAWQNNFGKTRSLKFGGSLLIPWTDTRLSIHFDNIQNLIYFDAASTPKQNSGNTQVMAASLQQNLHFGIWHWDNSITFQTSSNQDILPLPALTVYSNMYLKFTAFKVLQAQIGIDCDYYTAYTGYDYQPATMTFHVQDSENAVKVGNFPFANLYFTARLYKVRFYVLWSHFNQGWFTKSYFSLPHYPVNPRRLQFGLSIDFPN